MAGRRRASKPHAIGLRERAGASISVLWDEIVG